MEFVSSDKQKQDLIEEIRIKLSHLETLAETLFCTESGNIVLQALILKVKEAYHWSNTYQEFLVNKKVVKAKAIKDNFI